MVKIRLRRVGAKKQPSYRVVVADSRSPRDGRFIENIGHYNPRTDPPTVVVREDRALYWLSVGAQPTEAVALFFRQLGLEAKLGAVQGGASIDDVAEGKVRVSGPESARTRPASKTAKAPSKKRAEPEPEAAPKPEPEAAAPEPEPEPEGAAEAEAEAAAPEPEPEAAAPEPEPEAAAPEPEPEAAAPEPEPEAAAPEPEPQREPEAAPAAAAVADLALSEVDALSARTANALGAADVTSLSQLRALAAGGDEGLLEIAGIGPKAVEEIHAALGSEG